ncbi:hypothetical protein [Streptomyces echinatus]|uniref:hypothetical protein n=1 Tax=Streptomyces echinatus TaxID=67293 RepID=UPI00382857E1
MPTGRRVPSRPLPGDDPAAYVTAGLATAPTRYRATAHHTLRTTARDGDHAEGGRAQEWG